MDTLLSAVCLSILFLAVPVSGECRISGYTEFNGVCYKDFSIAGTQVQAMESCAEDGARLAMPRDNETDAFIYDSMTAGWGRWIGLTDIATEGDWVFQDGGTLASAGYSNWKDGEPNNSYGRENCAMIRQDNAKWNDVQCNATVPGFVCQLDAAQQTTDIPTATGPPYTTDLPETTGYQYTTSHTTQRSTLPGTTVSQYTTNHMAQRSTLARTTVSQYTTINQTGLAGGETAKSIGSWYNKPLNLALVCVGCAAGIIGVGGVLMYYFNRRQRRRQVAQDPQD
ncbi:uncharacterized protein LOC144917912 [Branchiostoma floridae x Branchiostoma belcheri]